MIDYRTTDIVLAATLRCHGYKLKDITVEGSRGTFSFEDVDSRLLNNYDMQKSSVEPIQFNNFIKTLTTSVRRHIQK